MGGAGARYHRRIKVWRDQGRISPRLRHHFWWLLHNLLSHPLLGVYPFLWCIWLHDWTSMHLNCRTTMRPSPPPVIQDYRAWFWHNTAGHIAIGLFPIDAAFQFHDHTAEAMQVADWV